MSDLRASDKVIVTPVKYSPQELDDRVADRGTQNYFNTIPANTAINLPIPGDSFYFPALSGLIQVAPLLKSGGKQSRNDYYSGTGLRLNKVNWFKGLELFNPSQTDDLFFYIVAGFDAFIDNRLTYPNAQFKQISIQTYSTYRAAATSVTVDDLSGTVITDDNGDQWYAVNRQLLLLFNNDSTNYWFLTNSADTKDEGSAQPLTSAQFPVSGDFKVKQGVAGASVNGIVTEIYNCLPKL